MEGPRAALRAGAAFEFAFVSQLRFAATGAEHGVALPVTPRLAAAVHAKVITLVTTALFEEGTVLFLGQRAQRLLFGKDAHPRDVPRVVKEVPFAFGVGQVAIAVVPCLDFESAVRAGECSAGGHGLSLNMKPLPILPGSSEFRTGLSLLHSRWASGFGQWTVPF